MSFISIEFALFVALVLLLYYIVPKRLRWIVLLVASYVFYALNSAADLVYIIFTTVSTYICTYLIEQVSVKQECYLNENKDILSREEKKAYKESSKKKQKRYLAACLLLNFGILAFLKYANIPIAYYNFYRLNHFGDTDMIPFFRMTLPLGISFYTFQTMGYLIDIYYGRYTREKNIFRLALYVSFFPQIVQGPISRFGKLAPELYLGKTFDPTALKSGFVRIMWGLFKKLIIADRLAGFVHVVMEQKAAYPGIYMLLLVFFYSMQIYGDFSGGIDVALGVSEMFGISMAENFERPFFSKSISEYWQRWHITLGTWFKDYIFYPLSLNKSIIKLGKKIREKGMPDLGKRIPIYIPMFFVWLLTGMWHGSYSRFVVWGLCNFFFIVLGTELEPLSRKITSALNLSEKSFKMRAYRAVKTFWLMSFLRLFDISRDASDAFFAFGNIFRGWKSFDITIIYANLSLPREDFIVAVVAITVMFCVELVQRRGSVRKRILALPVVPRWIIVASLIAAVSVFGYYGRGYDAGSFIYGAF